MSQGQQSRSLQGGLMKVGRHTSRHPGSCPPGATQVPALKDATNPKASRVSGPSFSCDTDHGDTLCRHFYQTL